jgi:hypothetical protein
MSSMFVAVITAQTLKTLSAVKSGADASADARAGLDRTLRWRHTEASWRR